MCAIDFSSLYWNIETVWKSKKLQMKSKLQEEIVHVGIYSVIVVTVRLVSNC